VNCGDTNVPGDPRPRPPAFLDKHIEAYCLQRRTPFGTTLILFRVPKTLNNPPVDHPPFPTRPVLDVPSVPPWCYAAGFSPPPTIVSAASASVWCFDVFWGFFAGRRRFLGWIPRFPNTPQFNHFRYHKNTVNRHQTTAGNPRQYRQVPLLKILPSAVLRTETRFSRTRSFLLRDSPFSFVRPRGIVGRTFFLTPFLQSPHGSPASKRSNPVLAR